MKYVAIYIIFAVLGFILVSNAQAADEWTSTDTKWEIAYQVVHAIDWGQTRYIAKHPERFYEKNPRLGRHPSVAQVNQHFILFGVAHYVIARALPKELRRPFQVITFTHQATFPINNAMIGIKVDF